MTPSAFVLYVWTVNLGRHVSVSKFRANAAAVLDDHDAGSAYGFQEIDEDDTPPEHEIVRELAGPDDHLVGWGTFEPIVVAGKYRVRRPRVAFAAHGVAHLTPTRHIVSCLVDRADRPGVPPVQLLDNHAPRETGALAEEISANRHAYTGELLRGHGLGLSQIYVGDENDPHFPQLINHEHTAVHAGLDYIRYVEHPRGARLEVLDTGLVDLTIDGHNAHWAKFRVSSRKEIS